MSGSEKQRQMNKKKQELEALQKKFEEKVKDLKAEYDEAIFMRDGERANKIKGQIEKVRDQILGGSQDKKLEKEKKEA